jgi:pimeloyl-ACP methyl ester carboxylesterase
MATDLIRHTRVATNGIRMHVAEAGRPGRPVVLLHGFPELWFSWRHQLPALADAGYHAIAPDLRGYGGTDVPRRPEDYRIDHVAADVVGLLDHFGYDRAVVVGHDWGAVTLWALCQLHPDRVEAAVPMTVRYLPPGSTPPTVGLEQLSGGKFFYALYFQQVGPPERELEADPYTTIGKMLWNVSGSSSPADPTLGNGTLPRAGTGLLTGMDDIPPELPPWISKEEIDYYAAEFERTGFFGAISYYRNIDANWELTRSIDPSVMKMPLRGRGARHLDAPPRRPGRP